MPDNILTKAATPIPTKTVVTTDYDALHQLLLQEEFVVIESDDHRKNAAGCDECVPVKSFVTYLNLRKIKLATKRIGKNRWVLSIQE
jgi:hypothetical protein